MVRLIKIKGISIVENLMALLILLLVFSLTLHFFSTEYFSLIGSDPIAKFQYDQLFKYYKKNNAKVPKEFIDKNREQLIDVQVYD